MELSTGRNLKRRIPLRMPKVLWYVRNRGIAFQFRIIVRHDIFGLYDLGGGKELLGRT